MNLTDASRIATKLVKEHCPAGWTIEWGNAKNQFGLCIYSSQAIRLSRPLTLLNSQATFEWVVKHEIAHVLAGPEANHGRLFKTHAWKLGISGDRCVSNAVIMEGTVTYTCPKCSNSGTQHKATYALFKKQACALCHKQGEIVRFVITRNGQPIPCPPKPKPRARRRRRR